MGTGNIVEVLLKAKNEASATIKQVNDSLKGTGTASEGASKGMKDAGAAAEDLGKKSKTAGDKAETAGSQLAKMNSRELAEKILSLAQNLAKVGDVLTGIAEGDVNKFRSGMDGAMHAAVIAVGAVAPQFAPLVAIIGVAVTQIGAWALGMEDAARKAEELKHQHEGLLTSLQRGVQIEMALAKSATERASIAFNAKLDEIAAEQDAYDRKKELGIATIEDRKATDAKLAQLRHEARLAAIAEDQAYAEEHLKAVSEFHKQEQDEERENAQAIREIQEEMIEGQKTGNIAFQNYMHAARFAGAKAAADADKIIADSGKKAADAQIKAAQDAQQKVVGSYQTMLGFIKQAMTDWQGFLKNAMGMITDAFIDQLAKQLAATNSTYAGATASAAAHTASANAFAGARATAEAGTIAPKAASAYASIPFVGVALAAAAIVAFFALINSHKPKMEAGGSPMDRINGLVPGFGAGDRVNAMLAPREFVVNERDADRTRPLLEHINQGGAVGGGGGAQQFEAEASFDLSKIPSDNELFAVLMRGMTIRVRTKRAELEASTLRTSARMRR